MLACAAILAFPASAKAPSLTESASTPTPREYLYWKAGKDANLLARIIKCESGWKPTAQNSHSTAGGLGQFLDSTWKKWGIGDKYDPYRNIDAMILLYRAEGTSPWLESRKCWQ